MFHFTEKDWADAELNCIALGGNLASIRTADDYAILREMANRAAGRDKATWLGGFDAVKEGVWAWSDGSTFEFTAWAKDEPNNHGSGEHCMEMNFEAQQKEEAMAEAKQEEESMAKAQQDEEAVAAA
ncbi:hypothetical protein PAMA_022008 [Pampus argenteus]